MEKKFPLCWKKKITYDFLFQIKLGNSEAQQVALSSGLESYKDTGVSRRPGDPIDGSPETPQPSEHYGIEELKGGP